MAVNDKPCFDVLFRDVILLPPCYSLEKRECMTPYGNGLTEGALSSHSSYQGTFIYVSVCKGGGRSPARFVFISCAPANCSLIYGRQIIMALNTCQDLFVSCLLASPLLIFFSQCFVVVPLFFPSLWVREGCALLAGKLWSASATQVNLTEGLPAGTD